MNQNDKHKYRKYLIIASLAVILIAVIVLLIDYQLNKIARTMTGGTQQDHIDRANVILRSAGLPTLPDKASSVECYSWRFMSAGLYAIIDANINDIKLYSDKFTDVKFTEFPISQEDKYNIARLPNDSNIAWNPNCIIKGLYAIKNWPDAKGTPQSLQIFVDLNNNRLYLYYSWS
jgi:hypothetical protein